MTMFKLINLSGCGDATTGNIISLYTLLDELKITRTFYNFHVEHTDSFKQRDAFT